MTESMIGKWDSYYRGMTKDTFGMFGCDTTYKLGYDFLKDCDLIEDWGAGRGFFKTLCKEGQYRGLDCSCTPHADQIVDFNDYVSRVDGIFMRHVLEHNYGWKTILRNALASFERRMVLVLFTPLTEETMQINFDQQTGTPDHSFRLGDITDIINEYHISYSCSLEIPTRTMYNQEHVIYMVK